MKNIYFGDELRQGVTYNTKIEYSVTSDGAMLQIPSPDMSETAQDLKLDFLYYSTVNRLGEVLTSLVAISDPRDADVVDEFSYAPATMLNRSALERDIRYEGSSNLWLNANLGMHATPLVVNRTYKPTNGFEKFDRETDHAATPYTDRYMYDGWYTVLTIAPNVIPNNSAVLAGTLRNNAGTIQYALIDSPIIAEDWSDLTSIVTTVPIADVLKNGMIENPFLGRDFFVTHRINAMYNGVINSALDKQWFTGIKFLRPKIRGLKINLTVTNYVPAQHIINSVDIALINQVI